MSDRITAGGALFARLKALDRAVRIATEERRQVLLDIAVG